MAPEGIRCYGVAMVDGFGTRLREFRQELGLTQIQFSGRLAISKQTLANIETGAQGTSIEVLVRLHELGADLNWLVAGAKRL